MQITKLLKPFVIFVIIIQLVFVFIMFLDHFSHYSTKISTSTFNPNTSTGVLASYIKMKIIQNIESEFSDPNSIGNNFPTEIDAGKYKNENLKLGILDGIHRNSSALKDRKMIISLGEKQRRKYNLGESIPSNQSVNILIVTRSRSGSSVLGNMINQNPGTYYTFEPLSISDDFGTMSLTDEEKTDLINNVFKCSTNEEFIKFRRSWKFGFDHNFRFKSACENVLEGDEACFNPDVYDSSCQLFPIRLIKTIRLTFEAVESLLSDPEIRDSLRIIFLFRDPRGRIQSLRHVTDWCNGETNIYNVTSLCQDLSCQIEAVSRLKEKYSAQVHLMRYEDLCLDGSKETDKLQKFLDLKTVSTTGEFVENQMVPSKAFQWINNIFPNEILEVETHCFKSMKYLGYKKMKTNAGNIDNTPNELMGSPSFDFF